MNLLGAPFEMGKSDKYIVSNGNSTTVTETFESEGGIPLVAQNFFVQSLLNVFKKG